MDDDYIVNLFWRRSDDAIMKVSQKYGDYCFSIANNILHNQEDSEECVNDTWFRAWNAIPPHKPQRLQLFLAKIVRNLSFDRYNSRTAGKRGGTEMTLVLDELSECIPGKSDVASEYEYRELVEIIRAYVNELPIQDCNIFLRRYFFTDTVSEIARRYDLNENHVMVILSRVRKKLRVYLEKEELLYEQK